VRDGDDLVAIVNLSAPLAALGTSITVPTLDGDEELDIAPGTQPGTVLTLEGLGMPSLRTRRRGDQRVLVNVLIPRNLDDAQRQMLESFSGTLTEENLREEPHDESLFGRVRRAFGN
jgi:molecular chaperone DnaJ